MNDYVNQLESRNEELQNTLTKLTTSNEGLTARLAAKQYFIIGCACRVNGNLINMECIHHLFTDGLSACERLKKNWSVFRKDFKTRFEPCKFEFKYFFVESYNINDNEPSMVKQFIKPVRMFHWAFETKDELDITIKTLKK